MGLREDHEESTFFDYPSDSEDVDHRKQVKRLLEERLEKKRLKDEFKDEFDDNFDWDAFDKDLK